MEDTILTDFNISTETTDERNYQKDSEYLNERLSNRNPVLNVLNVLNITIHTDINAMILRILFTLNNLIFLTFSDKWRQLVLGVVRESKPKEMAEKPLIKESLLLLDVCGLKSTNQNVCSLLRAAFAMALCLVFSVEVSLEIVFNWRGLQSMEGVAILAAIYQITFKLIMMIANSDQIVELLHKIDQFPLLEAHGPQIQHKIQNIYATASKYAKIILGSFVVAVLSFLLLPYFLIHNTLPFDTYHPVDRTKSLEYNTAYFLQVFALSYESFGLIGFDLLFISSILHLLWEIKIVKQRFSSIKINAAVYGDEESCLREVYQLINHHNLILECIKRLEKIYSMFLLNQFLSSLICIWAALLSIIANGFPPDGLTLFKYTAYLATGLSQLFSYCLAGAYLIVETESVAMAVYECDWWVKTQPKLRKSLVLVIQRANRTGKLTAGGMYILNLESFTGVVKNAFSFFTIVQAMYTRKD